MTSQISYDSHYVLVLPLARPLLLQKGAELPRISFSFLFRFRTSISSNDFLFIRLLAV